MIYRNQFTTHPLHLKFQKVCRQLQQLLRAGKDSYANKIQSLIKRRDKYARQLFSLRSITVKAGSAFAFSILLSAQVDAQTCNTFANADSANPIRRAGLPTNLIQPTFVDIDGDGDLDCYESSPNRDDGGSRYVKITFLRNTGSKTAPHFEKDSATGFDASSTVPAPYNSDIDRVNFVDIDGDGDYDCFVGSYGYNRSRALFYKNIGTKTKPQFVNTPDENPLAIVTGYYGLQLSFTDLDGDGDYDVTNTDLYSTHVFENVGTNTNPVFTQVRNDYRTTFARLTFYDYNKDGLSDCVFSYPSGSNYYKNTGTAAHPRFSLDNENGPQFPTNFQLYTFADLNNDGFAEAFSLDGNYATTSPVATVTSSAAGSGVLLQAHPADAGYKYQWRKDGKIISGATSNQLLVSAAGSYTVEVTGTCGTGISLPYVYKVNALEKNSSSDLFTKMDMTNSQPLLKAFPNPFASYFVLELGSYDVTNTTVVISDMQGRIVGKAKAVNSAMKLGSNLQKGVYIVQVLQNNTVVFTQKIIKQ